MQIKKGTEVFTADDKKVGHVERVVMNPKDNEVTHLVVEKGFFFTTDRVLPIEMVGDTHTDKIILKAEYTKDDFNNLPEFEETLYIPANEVDHLKQPDSMNRKHVTKTPVYPYYYYGAYGYGATSWQFAPAFWPTPDYVSYETKNVPEGSAVLKPGMDIITVDNEDVGSLDDVFMDSEQDRVSHFTLSKGMIFHETKAIPVHWIDFVDEDHIHLMVTKKTIESLPDYSAEPA